MLDVKMPEMDGMIALEQIKKDYPDVKVIMCSAVTEKSVIDSAMKLGAASYITKPFLPDTIIEKIKII